MKPRLSKSRLTGIRAGFCSRIDDKHLSLDSGFTGYLSEQ